MDTILSRERKMAKKLSTPKLVWVTFPLLPSTSKQVFGCVCDPGHCLQSPWWETEGDFVLEPTNPKLATTGFEPCCRTETPPSLLSMLTLFSEPLSSCCLHGNPCSLVISATLCCSDVFLPLFSFCFSELSLSFAFVSLQ